MVTFMEGETSWDAHPISYQEAEEPEIQQISEDNGTNSSAATVCLEAILPDDLLEKVFFLLPAVSIIRSASVCKRWFNVAHSISNLWNSQLPKKPWYFMFTCGDEATGYAYDPSLRKWYSIDLPCIEKSNWFISSSCGLVCFMDNDSRSRIFVCNPIARVSKQLQEPPGGKFSDYSALAMSANRRSCDYTVVVTKSKQVPGDFLQWDFSIHIYESESGLWMTAVKEVFMGWRGGDESVICNDILYCLTYATGVLGTTDRRHGLIMYDLAARTHQTSLLDSAISVPCSLTCGRLMNLKDKLVIVGGIGKPDRPDIIKGIGIWELNKRDWREITRMPHKYFQGFGEFDDVFASSGSNDLIYIQSYGAPALLVFDMAHKQWKWSLKCPVAKRFPLQLFTGFCFEPRFEVTS